MQKEMTTISGALRGLTAAVAYSVSATKWWKLVLWLVWFVAVIVSLDAVFASFAESEPRAAVLYGIVFLILLALGTWRLSRKPGAES
jgi:hypothetical protein